MTYTRALQTTWIPTFNIVATKTQSGTSSRYSKTRVKLDLERTFDETETYPFSITRNMTVTCDWGSFSNGLAEATNIVTIAPQVKPIGSVNTLGQTRFTSNLETMSAYVDVKFKAKRKLTTAEKNATYDCVVNVGRFLSYNISIPFK